MEPKEFGRVILRRKATVITAILVVMTVVGALSMRKQPQYVAACEVHFGAILADPTSPDSKPIEDVGGILDQVHYFNQPEVAATAGKIVKSLATGAEIAGMIHAEVVAGTQSFKLQIVDRASATNVHPEVRAAKVCNAVGQAYIQLKKDQAREYFRSASLQTQHSIDAANLQIDRVSRDITSTAVAEYNAQKAGQVALQASLVEQHHTLSVEKATYLDSLVKYRQKQEAFQSQIDNGVDGGPTLSSPALAGVATGADHKRDLLLGLIIGLLFGMTIAFFREYNDDTVRDKESTQRELGLPVLANLPDAEGIEGYDGPSSGTLEAARTLRATLTSMGVPHEKSMLLITSTLAKSRNATLVSLAGAFAESGRSVLVIGSDLRGGRTHESFGIANTVGLANVVRGQVPFERAIRPAPGQEGVYVLPCGPVIGNAGEVLSSEEMAFVLRRARSWADIVLLDAPPVLAAADSSILGAYADGVILVVSAGRTNRHQAIEAKEQLVAAGARVLGTVLVGEDLASKTQAEAGAYGDDISTMGGYWAGNDSYEADDYSNWYTEDVVTTSARMEPRQRTQRRAPAKKTAAASTKSRPAKPKATTVPRNARTNGARGGAAATRKPASGARKPAASKNGTAARKKTSPARVERARTPRRLPEAMPSRAPKPRSISQRSNYDW